MKEIMNRVMMMLFVGLVCFFVTGCANNPQLGYRGRMNAPGVKLTYLSIDPNAAYEMSPGAYAHLQQIVQDHNNNVTKMLENDRMAAQNAQIWTGNVNQDRYYSVPNVLSRGLGTIVDNFARSIKFE